MFICTECQAKYDIKPDFCDCGNDTFNEIIEKETISKAIEEKPSQPKIEPKKENKKEVRKITPNNIISYIIFTLCIILSIIIIFFVKINNETENKPIEQNKDKTTINKNIPSVDKIWNNELPKNIIKNETPIIQQQPAEKIEKPTIQTIQKQITKKENKNVIKNIQSITKPITKQTVQPKKATVTQQKTQTIQQKPQNVTVSKAQPKAVNTQTQQIIAQPKPTQTQNITVSKPIIVQQSQPVIDKKELQNYKTSLRNKIASKIDFTNIIGDGDCAVSFTINSSGKLINKNFTKKSENFSLNDAVYSAINQTTSYNPPPLGYNGETLKFYVKIYNSNYEVSLK